MGNRLHPSKVIGGEQLQIEASIAEEGEWQAENIPKYCV